MKSCEYYQELMSRLLDDDLTPEEDAALRAHMGTCPDCGRVYDALCRVDDAVRTGAAVEPPATLARSVMDRIAAHSRPAAPPQPAPSHRLRSWRKLAAAACFVVLVAAGAVTGVFSRGARIAGGGDAASYLPAAQDDAAIVQLPQADAGRAADSTAKSAPDSPAENASESIPESALSGASSAAVAGESAADAGSTEDQAPAEAGGESGIMAIMEPPAAQADGAVALPVTDGEGQTVGCVADTAALEALLTGETPDAPLPEPVYALSLRGTAYRFAADDSGGLLWWREGDAAPTRSPAALTDLEALILR